jgi:hypothetical protein
MRDTLMRRLIDILQGAPQAGLGRFFGSGLFYAFDVSIYPGAQSAIMCPALKRLPVALDG